MLIKGGWNYAKSQIVELILRKGGSRSAKWLKGRRIYVTFRKYMSVENSKIQEVAPEIFGFSKVALTDFEFDTPGLHHAPVKLLQVQSNASARKLSTGVKNRRLHITPECIFQKI